MTTPPVNFRVNELTGYNVARNFEEIFSLQTKLRKDFEDAVFPSPSGIFVRRDGGYPVTNDSAALGSASLKWSDLFLASGAVINFDSGNYTLTHSAALLTTSGQLKVGGNILLDSHYLSNDGGNEGISIDNSGNVTTSSNLTVNGSGNNLFLGNLLMGEILSFRNDVDADATGIINYTGYNAGLTRYRDLVVANGRSATIATFKGSDLSVTFAGLVTAPNLFVDGGNIIINKALNPVIYYQAGGVYKWYTYYDSINLDFAIGQYGYGDWLKFADNTGSATFNSTAGEQAVFRTTATNGGYVTFQTATGSKGYVGEAKAIGMSGSPTANDFGVYSNTYLYLQGASGVKAFGDATFAGNATISKAAPDLQFQTTVSATAPWASIRFTTNDGTTKWQVGTNQAIGAGFEINEGNYTNNRFYIAPGGNVLIGTTTSYGAALEVNGSGDQIYFGKSSERFSGLTHSNTDGLLIYANASSAVEDNIRFMTAGSNSYEKMRITSTSVLMGTTTDDGVNKLQVNGKAVFADTVKVKNLTIVDNAATGYVLKCSDGNGVASWVSLAASQVYKGTFDGSTGYAGAVLIVDGTGTAGWYYRSVVAGTHNYGSGNITTAVGDDLYYDGVLWAKIPGQGYTLQTATASVLGGVKVGGSLQIASDVLNVNNYDMGDITVAGTGADIGRVWTIDAGAVTYAKMQNVSAQYKVLGRYSASAGVVEEFSCTGVGSTAVLATSPTLVTPTLGVAAGTSLALGGATIAANALAVTGTSLFGGDVTLWKATPVFYIAATTNTDSSIDIARNEAYGSYNTDWYVYIPASSTSLCFKNGGTNRLVMNTSGEITTGIWKGSVIGAAYLPVAAAGTSGIVSATTQTFSGAKTFDASVAIATTSDAGVSIDAASSSYNSGFVVKVGGYARWLIGAQQSDNFSLYSYSTFSNVFIVNYSTGYITTGVWNGSPIADTYLATISTAGKVSGAAITSGTIGGTSIFAGSGGVGTTGTITTSDELKGKNVISDYGKLTLGGAHGNALIWMYGNTSDYTIINTTGTPSEKTISFDATHSGTVITTGNLTSITNLGAVSTASTFVTSSTITVTGASYIRSVIIENPTASTGGSQVQHSPYIELACHAWDTQNNADFRVPWRLVNEAYSSSGPVGGPPAAGGCLVFYVQSQYIRRPVAIDENGRMILGTGGGPYTINGETIYGFHGEDFGSYGNWPLILEGSIAGLNKVVVGSPPNNVTSDLYVTGVIRTMTSGARGTAYQVIGAQQAAIANATDATSVIARLNDLLAACRTHGLIAT